MKEYTHYYPHNNVSLVIFNFKKKHSALYKNDEKALKP